MLSDRRRVRRHRMILAVAAAGVVAAAAVAVVARTGREAAPPAASPSGRQPATASASATSLASADAGARQAELLLAGRTPTTVRYTFDAGPGRTILDSSGHHPLRQLTGGGGDLAIVPHGDGYAVRFPPRCEGPQPECPRAILESTEPELFNSGVRPLRYGAAVLMNPEDTAPGANVIQKGFSVGGGTQFKLQVDGWAGRPSCVLASRTAIYRITSRIKVADGRWHTVTCTRIGNRMSINVDGWAISRPVPAGLSIRNGEPLRIGGKSVFPGNDQFAGRVDDVFVTVY